MRDEWKWNRWVRRSGVGLYWLGQKLVDGCWGIHERYRGGGKPGILLSNSSRPGGLEH